ncbi:hypothetical protein CW304_33095 [Bacillus sp. UFRGS-B20]|nr:hypothetical protein CW304_33095 [Bacillus sp. UFRGS-B20]
MTAVSTCFGRHPFRLSCCDVSPANGHAALASLQRTGFGCLNSGGRFSIRTLPAKNIANPHRSILVAETLLLRYSPGRM